jgi:hypothetical protein
VNAYYDGFLAQTAACVRGGLMRAEHAALVLVATEPSDLLRQLREFRPALTSKWLDALAR